MLSIFRLLAFLLVKNDIVFDVNFGDGTYFLHMAELVGTSGSIVGFERSEMMYDALKANPIIESLWSMSLLINSKVSEPETIVLLPSYIDSNDLTTLNTPSEAYYRLNRLCPKLMRIASSQEQTFGDVYSSLIGSLSVLEQCSSVLLLEFSSTDAVEPVVELFNNLVQRYSIYWYRPEDGSDGLRRMLVVPLSLSLDLQSFLSELSPYQADWSSVDVSGAVGHEKGNYYRKHFTIDSEVLLSSLITEGLIPFSNDIDHSVSVLHDSHLSSDLLLRVANTSCMIWTRQVFYSAVGRPRWPLPTAAHVLSAFHSCTSFVQFRVQFVQNLLEERTNAGLSSSAAAGSSPLHSFVMSSSPFELRYDPEICSEPVWCSHAMIMMQRLRQWQFPDDSPPVSRSSTDGDLFAPPAPLSGRSCSTAKYLVFEAPSVNHGIGSMLQSVVAALRYAICLDRILVLLPVEQADTALKWRHPGCTGSMFECYFETLHGCQGAFTIDELYAAHVSDHGEGFEEYPRRDERILALKNIPNAGKCRYCHSEWLKESRFLDGWLVRSTNSSDYYQQEMLHVDAFLTSIKQVWTAPLLRYIVGRPRQWLSELLVESVDLSLVSPGSALLPLSVPAADGHFTFASLHVRFGNKISEVVLQPLTKYLSVLKSKLPHLRDVFISTETPSVLSTLTKEYPDLRFHWLHYTRMEYMVFGVGSSGTDPKGMSREYSQMYFDAMKPTYVRELVMSLANLWVASLADGFVGTLSSNWCMMILQMERTRGDGGYDYLSVDGGSAFNTCY